MTKKKITSRPGFFGTIKHYDSHGNKIGESRPGLFGTMNHYDSKGHKVGSSVPGLFGSTSHRDAAGHKVGSSQVGFFSTKQSSLYYQHRNRRRFVSACLRRKQSSNPETE